MDIPFLVSNFVIILDLALIGIIGYYYKKNRDHNDWRVETNFRLKAIEKEFEEHKKKVEGAIDEGNKGRGKLHDRVNKLVEQDAEHSICLAKVKVKLGMNDTNSK